MTPTPSVREAGYITSLNLENTDVLDSASQACQPVHIVSSVLAAVG